MNKHFKILTLIVTSLCTLLAGEAPEHVFLHGQSPLRQYLFQEELQSHEIRYSYLMPSMEMTSNLRGIQDFYQHWYTAPIVPISVRLNADLATNNKRQGLRQTFLGTVQLSLSERISIQNDFEIDSHGDKDAHYRGGDTQAFGDWTLYLQNSLLSYIYDEGHVLAGRGNLFSSVAGESIFINPEFTPAEHIWWHHTAWNISFDWMVKSLEAVNGNERFLSLHRYAYEKENWRLGFSEMVLVKYKNLGAQQFRYLMPASFFYETEVNGGNNANVSWNIDGLVKFKAYTIAGEFLIDDYALDKGSPPKLGLKLGLGHSSSWGEFYGEYVRVNRWTGNYFDPELRFIENGTFIGSPLGPDAHGLRIKYYKLFYEKLFTDLSLRWVESGAGNIHEWPAGIGDSANFGYNSEPFPSRPISTGYEAQLKVDYFLNSHLISGLRVKVSSETSPVFAINLRLAL